MQVIIDRIEGDQAVVELPDMTTIAVPLILFSDAKEGGVYQISKVEDEEDKRTKRMQNKFDNLLKKG